MKLRSVTYALLIAGVATFSTSSLAAQSLRFGYETSQTDSQHIAAKKFNELLQEKTKGELKLKLFPDSTLGNAQAMISGVRGGTIDMEMSGSNNFTGLSPVINLLDVPFLFRDTAHAHKTLEAAACAVYLHGAAADRAAALRGEYGMLPQDLFAQLGRLFAEHHR